MDNIAPTMNDLHHLVEYFEKNKAQVSGARIAVSLTWPEIKNAEYEVIKRFCIAAENIGAKVVVIDNDGYPHWASDDSAVDKSRPVSRDDIDFIISLHFESPKVLDIYSYYAIWQPLQFYQDFGYQATTVKLASHDDALSCSSNLCDAHVRSLLRATGRNPLPFPYLFHSPATLDLTPRITSESRLFYIGINWERLGQARKGRFHDLFRLLDADGVIDIYGPRSFLGVQPWEGYKTYRGEIPFDGVSVVKALNRSGICFAMSSDAHRSSGVMSNRLFEGLAAGTAIIANSHPIIDKYFSDIVYQISDTEDENEITFQVLNIIDEIRRDPEEANRRARVGQQRFAELFSLERCLGALIHQHDSRVADWQHRMLAADKTPVTIFVMHRSMAAAPLEQLFQSIWAQVGIEARIVLICDCKFATGPGKALLETAGADFPGLQTIQRNFQMTNSGSAMAEALRSVETEYFAILDSACQPFETHFSSLVRKLADDNTACAAVSGLIEETPEGLGLGARRKRTLSGLYFAPEDAKTAPLVSGRFLFRRSALDGLNLDSLSLLDGEELRLLLLSGGQVGGLVNTGAATCVHVAERARTQGFSILVSEAMQQQFIRDALQGQQGKGPFASNTAGLPTGSTDVSKTLPYVPIAHLGEMYKTAQGQVGKRFLTRGFSHPEEQATWIDGQSGDLVFHIEGAADAHDGELDLVLVLGGRPARATARQQHCRVSVNGIGIAYFPVGAANDRHVVHLPVGCANRGGPLRVTLAPDHHEPVVDAAGNVVDQRQLGLFLQAFGIFARKVRALPLLKTSEVKAISAAAGSEKLIVSGGVLSDAAEVSGEGPLVLRFQVQEDCVPGWIILKVASPGTAKLPEQIHYTLNGLYSRTITPTRLIEEIFIPVLPQVVGSDGQCEVAISAAPAIIVGEDGRYASLKVLSMETRSAPAIQLDTIYQTKRDGSGVPFLGRGFSKPETSHVWTDGPSFEIRGFIPPMEPTDGELLVECLVSGRPLRDGSVNTCRILINGIEAGMFRATKGWQRLSFSIPGTNQSRGGFLVTISFVLEQMPDPVKDRALNDVADDRRLGVQFASFGLKRQI
ncbi:hypothetical protein SAMN04488103_1206 [Gemmobacter aquatilis]|uniref:Spore protein YkvP/CgeB glycosyl transferase-like domain-containing protein n=1 Tax=Gemmobacter aquatilis TaxID=933059 RepID=A0A1H8NJI0_9RHOB|nr:glycosyltransferase [Gemmobacter aquatilis]SEO29649.1 hypothetical protein SAMN04488103_1206 [Gemmobacter aquatilis]